jgi:rod shape-determining protein MreC
VVGALQDGVSRAVRPVASFFSGLARVGSLQAENDRLRERVRELEQQARLSLSQQRELDRLVALYDLQQRLDLKGLGAVVIAQSVTNFEWSVTIDRGSSQGVRPNMPVVTGDGLVGRVVQVAPGWSKVLLIVDPRSSVAARLAGSGETGIVEGQTTERDLRMRLVDPAVEVAPEEQVVTSGYRVSEGGNLYPPGILIGYVTHAYQEPGGLEKLIAVRPAVDFSSLEFVLVVTGTAGG